MNRRVIRLFLATLLAAGAAVAIDASTAKFWRVSTQADLLKGQSERLSIDYDGRLVLGPSTHSVFAPTSPFVWCLTPGPDGSVYAGGGNDGLVWRIDRDGKSRVVFDAKELEVHALATMADGTLLVGTSPDGKVYRLQTDGKATEFFDPEDKYIWAIAVDAQGRVYVATGDKGVIYRVAADGKSEVFYKTQTTNVTSLLIGRDGQILAGTESPGRVLRITPAGKAFVLLESPYREIRGLRADAKGTVYAAAVNGKPSAPESAAPAPAAEPPRTAPVASVSAEIMAVTVIDTSSAASGAVPSQRVQPEPAAKGGVYRVDADGGSDLIWEFRDDQPFDLLVEDGGSLLVSTGNSGKIYRLAGEPWRAMLLTRFDAQQITAMLGTGSVRYFATSNPAHIVRVDAGRAAEGQYLSEAKDAGTVAAWGTLTWQTIQAGPGEVLVSTRSGNTPVPDDTWSDWAGPYQRPDGEAVKSPPARYLQWKAVLAGQSGSPTGPVLVSMSVAYLQRNLRPRVTSITVHPPGIVFQKPYPTGEPDIAGLGDAPPDARVPVFSAPLGGAAQSPSAGPPLGRRMYQKGLQAFAWKAEDDNDDRLQYSLYYRQAGEADWKLLRRDIIDQIAVWDTMSVADGTYVVKVAATDSPSNSPSAALIGEQLSAAFDVDNSAPAITVQQVVREGGSTKVVFDVVDSFSPVATVEYSVDTGRWQPAYPLDGSADSRQERFEIRVEGDAAGRVVIRAADSMNNAATARVPPSATTKIR
jgi:outer membrane protein assembly factor BamB